MTEIEQTITRAYDALTDVAEMAEEIGSADLLWATERARDAVNALSSHPDVVE